MSPIQWTEEELAAMAAADAEIDAEFDDDDYFVTDEEHRALDAELDKLAVKEDMPRKEYVLRERKLARKKAYNLAHREDHKAYMRQYRKANAEKLAAAAAAWYQRNRDDTAARCRQRYKEDPQIKKQYQAAYYRAHRDQVLDRVAGYQKAHRIEHRYYDAKWKKVTRALKRLNRRGGEEHDL